MAFCSVFLTACLRHLTKAGLLSWPSTLMVIPEPVPQSSDLPPSPCRAPLLPLPGLLKFPRLVTRCHHNHAEVSEDQGT
jgi:hypothetical protein